MEIGSALKRIAPEFGIIEGLGALFEAVERIPERTRPKHPRGPPEGLLLEVLERAADEWRISPESIIYRFENLGSLCRFHGTPVPNTYDDANVVIPLSNIPDEATYTHGVITDEYLELECGLGIPSWVARQQGLYGRPYERRERILIE